MTPFDSSAANELNWMQNNSNWMLNEKANSSSNVPQVFPERVEFLWPGRIAVGKQSLVGGEAGLGKSQLTNSIGATVTNGGSWPCNEGTAPLGSVLFLCAEDGASDTVVPRLMAAGADLKKVFIVTAVRGDDGKGRRAFNLQSDLEHFEAKITRDRRCAFGGHRSDQQLPRPEG